MNNSITIRPVRWPPIAMSRNTCGRCDRETTSINCRFRVQHQGLTFRSCGGNLKVDLLVTFGVIDMQAKAPRRQERGHPCQKHHSRALPREAHGHKGFLGFVQIGVISGYFRTSMEKIVYTNRLFQWSLPGHTSRPVNSTEYWF